MSLTVSAQSLFFLLLNFCAGSIAFVLAARSRPGASLVDFFLAWATWFLALIVGVETGLGVLGLLTPLALALTFGAGAAVAWAALLKGAVPRPKWPHWADLCGRGRAFLRSGWAPLPLAFAGWLTVALLLAALMEPSAFFDTFVYHLPLPADWLQRGSLTPAYIPFAEVSNSYFPAIGELLYFWALAPFRNDLIVRLVPLAMWLLLGLSLWRVCRQAGARRDSAAIVTVIFLFAPVVLSEATELSADVAAAALFLLALGHLIEYARRPALAAAALFGLAAGLFVGAKYSGPAYLALLLAGFAAVAWRTRRSAGRGPLARACAVIALAVAATGGYWYIRNLAEAGNPLYPLSASVGGLRLLPGPGLQGGDAILEFLRAIGPRIAAQGALDGYGAAFWLALAVAAVAGLNQLLRRGAGAPRPALLGVAVLMIASLALYLQTPYSIMRYTSTEPITPLMLSSGMRFSLVAGACTAVLAAVGLNRLPREVNPAWFIALVGLAQAILAGYDATVYQIFQWRIFTISRLLGSAVLVSLAFIGFVWRTQRPRRVKVAATQGGRGAWVAFILALLALFSIGAAPLKAYREGYRYALYRERYGNLVEGWRWIDENVNAARVAYIGEARMLPAYGADLSNDVRYVNIDGALDDRYDDFYARGAGYRAAGDYGAWLRNLAAWSAQYLVVAWPDPVVEDRWARQHPGVFAAVYDAGRVRVYRIDAAALRAALPAQ